MRDVCSREIQSVHVYVLLCARKSVPAAGVDCGAWGIVCPDASSWVTWDPQPVTGWTVCLSPATERTLAHVRWYQPLETGSFVRVQQLTRSEIQVLAHW